ncbi:MAG: short chain dehydrogenase [Chloroflexi bacterium RBG_16_56_11]|nr:MAG: short chain dehydrogenase [Chloroflexi bacterium RBG_16_56_11]
MAGLFQGKVAVVTGAGLGLGRAAAMAFAREGARVVVADIDSKNGQLTVDAIKKAGGEAMFIKTDVSREADVAAMVDKTVADYGRLDCAHNNVGIEELPHPITEGTEEQWYRLVDVDLKGIWLCLKHEIKYMENHGGGSIVNTSSIAGLIGAPGQAIYSACKWGVNGLTKSAAADYAKKGIRVNSVCPAGMKGTGFYKRMLANQPGMAEAVVRMVPLGRDSEPEEIAEAVIWLCSDRASYVTGAVMPIDGGFTVS